MQYAVSKVWSQWLTFYVLFELNEGSKTHRNSVLACTHKTEKLQSTLRSDSLLTHYIPNQPCHLPAVCRPSVLESNNCDQTPPRSYYTRQTSINQPSWIRPSHVGPLTLLTCSLSAILVYLLYVCSNFVETFWQHCLFNVCGVIWDLIWIRMLKTAVRKLTQARALCYRLLMFHGKQLCILLGRHFKC